MNSEAEFIAAIAASPEERYQTHPDIAVLLLHLTLSTKEVVEPLREALRAAAPVPGDTDINRIHHSGQTREIAARALSMVFLWEVASAALPELLPLLRDPVDEVRRQAAETLGTIGSADAVPGLRAALRDGDEKVRAVAAVALGKIGATATVSDLAFALRDVSVRVRREAATALGKIRAGGQTILEALRSAEKDADKGVRREATAARKKIERSAPEAEA
jgi:HEAT repeat protein